MNKKIKYLVPYKIGAQVNEDLSNNLAFLHKSISAFEIQGQEIVLTLNDSTDEEQIIIRLNTLMDKVRPLDEDFTATVLFQNKGEANGPTTDPSIELEAQGDVINLSAGRYAFRGLFLKMVQAFDFHALAFARRQLCDPVEYPVGVSMSDLKQAKFFEQTPQFAQFISLLHEDAEDIKQLAKELKEKDGLQSITSYLSGPQHVCRSAVCMNCYPAMRNLMLKKGEHRALTTVGRVFRNESLQAKGLLRLNEFSVRDTVYVGDAGRVNKMLLEALDWYKEVISKLGLRAIIQSATDPFFAENLQQLQFYQLAQQSKFEIRLWAPCWNKDLSCGSLNNHGSHFSKAFEIHHELEGHATTGCVGFGHERFVYGVLCQWGVDSRNWPTEVRRFFLE